MLPVQAEFDVLFDLEKCCLRLYNYPIKAFRDEIQMNSFTKESWHSKKFINFFTQIDQESTRNLILDVYFSNSKFFYK